MAKVSQIGKVPSMGKKFWKVIGELIGRKGIVYNDCTRGIMQNNTRGHSLSPQYKKYKDNDMRRFTTDKRGKKGDRLKNKIFPLLSRSLETIGKPYVTMILTGDTISGLHGIKPKKNSITMTFERRDTVKILGNKARGYDITGLNTKNIKRIKVEMIKQFNRNKVKFIKKNITINIGK